jgi:hypothetical protein
MPTILSNRRMAKEKLSAAQEDALRTTMQRADSLVAGGADTEAVKTLLRERTSAELREVLYGRLVRGRLKQSRGSTKARLKAAIEEMRVNPGKPNEEGDGADIQ